jgi:hypothetical protein
MGERGKEKKGKGRELPFPLSHFPFPAFYYHPMEHHHVPRHVPARTNDGWPVVGLITVLTVALIIGVTVIHKRTYKHPTDPTNPTGGKHEAPAATH